MAESMSIWSRTQIRDFHLHDLKNRKLKDKKLKGIHDVIFLQQLRVSGEQLPIQKHLKQGFLAGSSLLISGYIQPNADRVAVNLCNFEDDDDDDIVLHFNPRFDEGEIVRNTCKDDDWGEEERAGGFPLRAGEDFSLKINCEEHAFEFYINEQMFGYYEHRMKPKKITHVEFEGAMILNLVLYKTIIEDEEDLDGSSSDAEPSAPPEIGFEAGIQGLQTSIWTGSQETGQFPIYNPLYALPDEFYRGIFIRQMKTDDEEPMKVKFDKNFTPGSSVIVHGRVEHDAERFELNLWSKTKSNGDKKKDIAFHFNPRFDEGEIVRNTFRDDDWGAEVRAGNFPLALDTVVTIQINCEESGFRVLIDGTDYTFYQHRMSPMNITKLEVEGALDVYSVFYKTN